MPHPHGALLIVLMCCVGCLLPLGLPKGVEITHANLVAGVAGISGSLPNLR